ncbi:FluC/FEX family fluoride channel [Paenibacillus naphthalenovorans]|uniref:Fluoride-specific ion channel FluC n=1 Tax=Paenibacillus naphthalenovorans TaxID=162209 RepID=A0A0U2KXH1_9BACL|nr:CrcB family protein [Paenibacillus naphthalenovorans]ALS21506.1 fluoride ion transporter CrcB [Paenibacillus naphthalenovorans]GCL71232.1 CrcB family protein [Paenibacillus naphthalenovorans]SDI76412.1 CrcB protein [Paenibacillus naphthalenovorans]
MTAVYIGLAGVAGALARYGMSLALNHGNSHFPWGTLLCNLAGCLLLGRFAYSVRLGRYPRIRAAVTTGFIGSFTTFSALSWEFFELLGHGQYASTAVYFLISLWGGLLCVHLGRRSHVLFAKRGSAE